MIAALPMYDRPENRAAHNRLWELIRDNLRDRGVAAPDALEHDIGEMEGWAHPDLCLGQICNLPWRAHFRDKVTVIGAADYGLPDCDAGFYRALFIVRKDDPAQKPEECLSYRFAINDGLSNSGYGAAQIWAQKRGASFTPTLRTGSHLGSLNAVAEGRADLATIDAQTFRMCARWEADAQMVKVIGSTDASPGMTFITKLGQDPAPFRSAIKSAIESLDPVDQECLGLRGIVELPRHAYEIPLPPKPPELA